MTPRRLTSTPCAPGARLFALALGAFALGVAASGCASAGRTSYDAQAPAPAVTPVKDQRALDALKQMGDALAGAKSMSFEVRSMTPIQGPNAQWIHVFATDEVKMQRPDKLFIQTGGDAFPQRIYFNGKVFAASAAASKLYTQLEMPGSVDTMLAQAAQKAGYSFSFSDVLVSDPFASWSKDLEGAVYVGESVRGGEKLSHLALTAKDVDWEVWIGMKDHLPHMVFVKYTGARRAPSVLIEFSKWKLGGKFSASTFSFKAPAGAKKAAVKVPGETAKPSEAAKPAQSNKAAGSGK